MYRQLAVIAVLASLIGIPIPIHAASMNFTKVEVGKLPSLHRPVRTVPLGGPPNDYTPEQRFNFEIGQIAAYLKACGYYPLSHELRSFKTDADAFQKGYGTLAGADGVTGGCAQLKNSVEEWIEEQRQPQG